MILDKIVTYKEQEVKREKAGESTGELKEKIKDLSLPREFKKSLKKEGISLIAEVKKASPSKGIIKEDFKPLEIAKYYQQSGARALSVLTDRKFFQGDLAYLQQIKKEVKLPLLRKDFIIDPYQIYQARAYGADAVLLIAAILEESKAEEYLELARELGLDVLFEIHNKEELELALEIGADIIGINNRDLTLFEVDLATTLKLQRLIPEDKIIVSESGIKTGGDVKLLTQYGVDAVLIGEALMKADDIEGKVKELQVEVEAEVKKNL